jgi:hypothetical protein
MSAVVTPETRPPFIFTFITDVGVEKLTYAEYLKRDDLRKQVNDEDMARLFLGRTIVLFSKDFLAGNEGQLEMYADLEHLWKTNPLQFFAPATYEAQDAINDWIHDVVAVVAPNRVGKTTLMMVKLLLGAIPMKRDWPIFAEHGVDYVPFRDPMELAVSSYKEKNLRDTIWPKMIRFWTPDSELGVYGKQYKGTGARSNPSWGHESRIELTCGSAMSMFTYEQDQDVYESGVFKRRLWDEQGKENLFDGADERCRTVRGIHFFSLTPHKVEGRPDTGAGSFVHKMLTGEQKKGHNPKTYTMGVREMLDWIYPESEKQKAFDKWENEPRKNGNSRVLREGRARLYGEWHSTAGLVITSWEPEYSWIDPLWEHPPDDWTCYRAWDHGKVNPTCGLCLAVNKNLDVVIYRELYTKGDSPFQNVRRMVQMSGNSLRKLPSVHDDNRGVILERFEEVYDTEVYAKQVLDGRSFAGLDDSTSKPVGWLYKCAGLKVVPASTAHYEQWIPMFEEYLHVDPERVHLVTGKKGASRMYVFNTCVNWKREIEGWHWMDTIAGKNESDKPADIDNHSMSASGYSIQIPLRFLGDIFQTGRNRVREKPWYEEKRQGQVVGSSQYRRL